MDIKPQNIPGKSSVANLPDNFGQTGLPFDTV